MTNDDSEPATAVDARTLQAMREHAVVLKNGVYTVSHPTRGHFTVKLHTVRDPSSELAGRRIFSMLVGPNNTTDYKGVAFWNERDRVANVWRRFRGTNNRAVSAPPPIVRAPAPRSAQDLFPPAEHDEPHAAADVEGSSLSGWTWNSEGWSTVEQKLTILLCLALRGDHSYWRAEGYKLLVEGRCYVCNKRLTTPESIETGIGPVCARR